MNNVNKTLYIPLYGKAYVSKRGIILKDEKAERIWEEEGFKLKGKSKSKWLAFYMGMRSAVFDNWLKNKISNYEDATILHIGCGLDNRLGRVNINENLWYDIDFAEVIEERKRYYSDTDTYHMISTDVRQSGWISSLPKSKNAIIVMEGISMYLKTAELKMLLSDLCTHFENISLLIDCYTTLAAKISKIKNPVKDVGVSRVYGIDNPELIAISGLSFKKEHNITPDNLIDMLEGFEKRIFKKLYAGGFSKKLYRLFEYEK